MSLRARLAQLETQAAEQGEEEGPSPWAALLSELPELVLRILAGEEVDFEAETDALMALDPEATRRTLAAILDLAEIPDLLEPIMGAMFDE